MEKIAANPTSVLVAAQLVNAFYTALLLKQNAKVVITKEVEADAWQEVLHYHHNLTLALDPAAKVLQVSPDFLQKD